MGRSLERKTLYEAGKGPLEAFVDLLADAVAQRLASGTSSQGRRLFSVDEAAAYIGRSPRATRHLIASGTLPVVREGRSIHLDRADLDRWIELRRGAA